MKSLKKIIKEWSNHGGFNPRSEGEKHFVAMHKPTNFKNIYSAPEYDALFKGAKVKVIDRHKDNHGYNNKEDERKYDGGLAVKNKE